ncbi:MAG: hypothetical protein ABIO99_08020 [Candidatus Limnocylindria bacterium]
MSELIMSLEEAGKSEHAIDAAVKREFGAVRIPFEIRRPLGVRGPMAPSRTTLANSDGSCVALATPRAYLDVQAGAIAASATWKWKTVNKVKCWTRETSAYGGNVGGFEAFGLYVDTPMNYKSGGGNSYTESGTRYRLSVNDWNSYGIVVDGQDRSNTGNRGYTWDHGNAWMYFNIKGCPARFTMKSKYAHTWSNTQISSLTMGTAGYSVTFSSSSSQWQAVNGTVGYYQAC